MPTEPLAARSAAGAAPETREKRELGPRAQKTRERLLEALSELLAERSVREVSVVDVARRAGTSPATFYQYFADVGEAILALAERAADEMPAMGEIIEGSWIGEEGLDRARQLVEAYLDHWDEHRAVLRVRNLAADEGDERFLAVRIRASAPVGKGIVQAIRAGQKAGRVDAKIVPRAAAAALGAVLERLAAYHRELELGGVSREDLVETTARLVLQAIRGHV